MVNQKMKLNILIDENFSTADVNVGESKKDEKGFSSHF